MWKSRNSLAMHGAVDCDQTVFVSIGNKLNIHNTIILHYWIHVLCSDVVVDRTIW